jgi:hypothetical protein
MAVMPLRGITVARPRQTGSSRCISLHPAWWEMTTASPEVELGFLVARVCSPCAGAAESTAWSSVLS